MNLNHLVNENSKIDKGFLLSDNFNLEHATSGAFHRMLGKWIPQYSSVLSPQMPNGLFSNSIPIWKVVQNLQIGSNTLLEGLLKQSGNILNIKSGYLNNLIPSEMTKEINHLVGQSFDISLSGYEDNLYHVAKDIQQICYKAQSIDVIYGANSCHFHINMDPKRALDNLSKIELPTIRSIDLIDNEVVNGIAAMRGYV